MATTLSAFDVRAIRAEFPALDQQVHGKPLVYLDNAATTQKPQVVIDALRRYYEHDNANIHRGVHALSERASKMYEDARGDVRRFVNAKSDAEIVFTRNATESINLVARAWGDANVTAGDEILITAMEHHSNIVPWQQLCARTGAVLKVAPIDDRGALVVPEFEKLLGPRTKMVAMTQLSNALGTVVPVAELTVKAHAVGAMVLIDGSQAAYHFATDVQALGCDFFVFTGHKVYGPTGI
ncbi:MAG: aminotransferase class V-fold PLP-dependent enzyme, partial [Acidobacteria bacterium]|nr:aminotransferase class V-fold PLP-dependent enzyme [Acidobacteriota bacterium]